MEERILEVKCICGETLEWNYDNFDINIIGSIEFKCCKCLNIITFPNFKEIDTEVFQQGHFHV